MALGAPLRAKIERVAALSRKSSLRDAVVAMVGAAPRKRFVGSQRMVIAGVVHWRGMTRTPGRSTILPAGR